MSCIYYIDSRTGSDDYSGLCPDTPLRSCTSLALRPGDSVLFARGSIYREGLMMAEGTADAPVYYGSYGEGELPRFYGSVSLTGKQAWREEAPCVWKCTLPLMDEPCNLIFDGGRECGNLCWEQETMAKQGDWYSNGLGVRESPGTPMCGDMSLYLYSTVNPGSFYRDIECALHGSRALLKGAGHAVAEKLAFWCGGVHGYAQDMPEDITIRSCEFHFIGGCVWNRERRIRFGNGVELWDGGRNILVENCLFDNIYDSCVTHQGSPGHVIPEHITWRGNRFRNYGMAAFEYREYNGRDIIFENNICLDAGLGFSMQNEMPPRQSEIWPQPMGHHIFIWNITDGVPGGRILIRNNLFCSSPYGAAVYSIASPEAEAQVLLQNNRYYKEEDELWIHFNGKSYGRKTFRDYQKETGQDEGSEVLAARPAL